MPTAKKSKLTLDEHFQRVEEYLVGLWRFRVRGQKPAWCCTYVYEGCYYDTLGKPTREEALENVYRNLIQLKRRRTRRAATE